MEGSVSQNPTTSPESTGVLTELLKQRHQQGFDLLSHYIKAFSVYVAIVGALLKFALDSNSNPALRSALVALGLLLSAVGLFACYLGRRLHAAIAREIALLSNTLNVPPLESSLVGPKYFALAVFCFVALVLIGCCYLLFGFA